MRDKLTINQVSECLNKSRQTIMDWIKDGRFPNAEKDRGVTGWWFVPVDDVERVRQELLAEYKAEIEAISKPAREWAK